MAQARVAAFQQALAELGWTGGRNLKIEWRWTGGDIARVREYAAELVRLAPEVILAQSTPNVAALKEATTSIPIVFAVVNDPVAQGFIASMAHPGGNITGFSFLDYSMVGKSLEMLKEIAPSVVRVAVMFNPETSPQSKFFMRSVEAAASSLGVQAIAAPVRATTDIEPAIENFARQPNGGLILPTDSFIRLRQGVIADIATRHRLPTISAAADFAKDGGLMNYGVTANLVDDYRQAASYVDRILKGAKPNDLPVQAPTKYSLVINLKTAKALGLTMPLPLLGLADEVIE